MRCIYDFSHLVSLSKSSKVSFVLFNELWFFGETETDDLTVWNSEIIASNFFVSNMDLKQSRLFVN